MIVIGLVIVIGPVIVDVHVNATVGVIGAGPVARWPVSTAAAPTRAARGSLT